MLNGNTAHNLQPQPLPEDAFRAASDSIMRLGFPAEGILKDYSFSIDKVEPVSVNALAFAHATRRNPGEYASFTVYNATLIQHNDEAIVSNLAKSTAPFHLIHRGEHFSFWASSVKDGKVYAKPIRTNISYDQLAPVLSDYSVDLNPQRTINVKQGRDTFTLPIFRDIYPLQLSLWVADVTGDLLVQQFAYAVESLRHYARTHRSIAIRDRAMTSLAIQLLGATILADTGVLGDGFRLNEVSLDKLISQAEHEFPRYFQRTLFQQHIGAAEEAYHLLRQIRYSGFVPEMLASVYTAAFSKEQRKKLGRYDTPLYLTRRIWEHIPVEYLPPQQRHVVDMTCGWGSFLIAGHERYAQLSDTPSSLRSFLHGNDIDPFTSQLAGLGLLLSTSEDSWHVDHSDALDWQWLETKQPNIIVGNPPFGSIQDSSITGVDSWHEEANRYLALAIERLAPHGYLAMVMPRSFTSSLASRDVRKQLLEHCDVLELWELPVEVFLGATARTLVIFARKSGNNENPTRLRTIQPLSLKPTGGSETFPFTASGLLTNQSAWNKHPATQVMDYQIVLSEYMWRVIRAHSVNIQEIAEVVKGASRGSPKNRRWANYPFPKEVPWLTGVKKVMPRSFTIDYTQARTIRYPNDLEEPRKSNRPGEDKEPILADTKVLVVYDPDTTWGKRNKLAIERNHHYPSDSFWVIAPNAYGKQQGITCEVLAAVLDWDVSNAWIVEHLRSPAIPKRVMSSIPFPKDLSSHDYQMLTEAIWKIEEAASHNQEAPREATNAIDTILKAAYHLEDATFERLRQISEWDKKPQITLDVQPDHDKADCFVSGFVESVDAKEGTITFDIKGFDEFQTVQIVPSMSGWLLRSGAAFYTRIPHRYVKQRHIEFTAVDWDTFHPQTYTYMSEVELMDDFVHLFEAK